MRFKYCPDCGSKAAEREIGDEGLMPYCEKCGKPLFDVFSACVLCVVVNEQDEIALIKQSYVNCGTYVGIAGYIKPGESAEEAAARETAEEIGIEPVSVELIKTYPYPKKDMLMLGFRVNVIKKEMKLSGEVDAAKWFKADEAEAAVREGSIIGELIRDVLEEM
ncbi:MAG: NUDIX domain-containing protein [Ruminococcus sp.]|nr:NUDIX domain-containing protein [Ruminococcus sp.]